MSMSTRLRRRLRRGRRAGGHGARAAACELVLTPTVISGGIPRMIKTRIAVMALALSFMAAGACFAANPQMGTWKLNEAKSKLAPEMGKNTMVTYTEEKDKIKVTVEGVNKDGKPRHSVWVGKFDGKAYPLKGNVPVNSIAYRVVNDRTNEITAMKDGKVMWSGRIEVAADGKSRTATISGTDEKGKKFKSTAVYDKE